VDVDVVAHLLVDGCLRLIEDLSLPTIRSMSGPLKASIKGI